MRYTLSNSKNICVHVFNSTGNESWLYNWRNTSRKLNISAQRDRRLYIFNKHMEKLNWENRHIAIDGEDQTQGF